MIHVTGSRGSEFLHPSLGIPTHRGEGQVGISVDGFDLIYVGNGPSVCDVRSQSLHQLQVCHCTGIQFTCRLQDSRNTRIQIGSRFQVCHNTGMILVGVGIQVCHGTGLYYYLGLASRSLTNRYNSLPGGCRVTKSLIAGGCTV